MAYFNYNDDEISFDTVAVKKYIEQGEDAIDDLRKNITRLVYYVEELEKNAHDIDNTRVSEDYKDFETILGYYGLASFSKNLSSTLEEIKSGVKQYERIVARNKQIKLQRERREAMLKKQTTKSNVITINQVKSSSKCDVNPK